MRTSLRLTAWMILAAFAGGAAAPKKVEKPASRPSTQPADQPASRPNLRGNLKFGMTEEEAAAALKESGVTVVKKGENGSFKIWVLSDTRNLGFKENKLASITKPRATTRPATRPG